MRYANIDHQDAAYLHSREARAAGQANPPKGSLSADAESLAASNEGRANGKAGTSGPTNPADQSARDRLDNFQQASEQVGSKMATNPEAVSKEEADLLHSREQRAFGATSKGGIASQAQSLAADNEGK
jgi:hypothetical protein